MPSDQLINGLVNIYRVDSTLLEVSAPPASLPHTFVKPVSSSAESSGSTSLSHESLAVVPLFSFPDVAYFSREIVRRSLLSLALPFFGERR